MKQKKRKRNERIFDRQTGKWVLLDNVSSLKKPKTCRGGKPHDWQLVIPDYISLTKPMTEEMAVAYYESEERVREFTEQENKKLDKIGIKSHHWTGFGSRHYRCKVCDKKDWR